jgi:hypothetical protein
MILLKIYLKKPHHEKGDSFHNPPEGYKNITHITSEFMSTGMEL